MVARRIRELCPRDRFPQGRDRGESEREGRWLQERRDFRLEWLRCVAFDGALESLLCLPNIRSILGLHGLEQLAGVRDLYEDNERGSFLGRWRGRWTRWERGEAGRLRTFDVGVRELGWDPALLERALRRLDLHIALNHALGRRRGEATDRAFHGVFPKGLIKPLAPECREVGGGPAPRSGRGRRPVRRRSGRELVAKRCEISS